MFKYWFIIMIKERLVYIDTAKAICIFLMVIGHSGICQWLNFYIYSFHMPALFIISGFLYKPHSWRKTIVSFFIPILFFSFINLIVKLILGDISISFITFPNIVFEFIHYRYGLTEGLFMGDWFLWALIGLRFMFGDIIWMKGLRNYYLYISLFAILYMTFESYLISVDTIFRGYYIGRLVPCLPFFCFGFYLKDKKWKPENITFSQLLPLILVFLILPYFNRAHGINSNNYGISYLVFLANAILSSLLIFYISNKVPSSKVIQTISKGTLVVLGVHMPIMDILKSIMPNIIIILPIVTFVICYFVIKICDKYCPVLLGK